MKHGGIALFLLVVGCASVPEMPKYETNKEKACARQCQATHAQCMIGRKRLASRTACGQLLGQCYESCKGLR